MLRIQALLASFVAYQSLCHQNLLSLLQNYSKEPAKENILFNNPKAILTPHIAASTTEASIVVAEMAANQISDFLLKGTKINTV